MDIAKVQASKYRFFTVGAIGTFMATLDGSILNVALPSIAKDLDAPVQLVAWVVLAYSLTMISLLLAFGVWTERRGYRFAYRFGYIFFLAGSILCACSTGIYVLIASRVMQAMGTAMFAAVGPGMVTTVFPSEERGKGLGIMVMMVSAGFMVGPPLGGFILGQWSWHVIFLINIPVGIFGLFWIHKYFGMLPPPRNPRRLRLASPMSASLSIVSGVFALTLLDDFPLTDPRLWGLGLLSLTSFITFLKLESIPQKALIGLGILRNRQFTTSLGAQLTHFCGLSGVTVLLPFYLERVRHLTAQQVGMYLVILPIMMFLVAPNAGRLSDKIGFRLLTAGGTATIAIGLYLLSGVTLVTESWYIVACLVVVGGGVGMFSTPNASAFMGSVSQKQRAISSGILATNRNIGMSTGVALSTTLFAYLQMQNIGLGGEELVFIESFRPVVCVAAGFALLSSVFCLIRSNRSRSHDDGSYVLTDRPFNSG
ncbi:MAG: hypothetical protein DRP45_10040 [Candidatus Zixiibacteriota bacterium]|nr:MAG: hypothetical protein DRP45_10040 [candidate division Zixibacteria bacterium]